VVDYLTYTPNVGHRGVLVMFGKQHGVVVYLVVLLAVTLSWVGLASAQQQAASAPAASPLVHILQAKGILTAEEVAQINQASSASDADQRLAKLLLSKGVISQTDYNQMMGTPAVVNASAGASTNASMIPTVLPRSRRRGHPLRPCSILQRGFRRPG